MTDAASFIATANKLLSDQPSQTDIRRAVSTAYYALFHHVCLHFGRIVQHPAGATYVRAGLQAYRYLDHGPAKQRCFEVRNPRLNFPAGIITFAEAFIDLQEQRTDADYNPNVQFTETDARTLIKSAEAAVATFDTQAVEAQRAFVVFLGLRAKGR